MKVTVTGAAGNIGYALVFMIGQGRLLGPDQPIELTLLELPAAEGPMKACLLELQDSALPLVTRLRGTIDMKDGFSGCQIAILVGAKPRGQGMQRKDLLVANASIFKSTGQAINEYASADCKVIAVGNPANTNAMIAAANAPRLPTKNFSALTRLDENRAVGLLAERMEVHSSAIKSMIIWGNHSATMVPDYHHATVSKAGSIWPVRAVVADDQFLETDFCKRVQKRGEEVIGLRKMSSAASAANAVCDHVRTLFSKDPSDVHSMGVISANQYGIRPDLCFSYPVICCAGEWRIIEGLGLSEDLRKKLKTSEA